MLLSPEYFAIIFIKWKIEEFAESRQCKGTGFVILKQGGCALQIKVAGDQEHIFHFELHLNKVQ